MLGGYADYLFCGRDGCVKRREVRKTIDVCQVLECDKAPGG